MKFGSSPREGIYRRVSVRMYGDAKFMRLSPMVPSGQSLFVYVLTGPHTGPIPGVFVMGKAAMAETLGWETEAFEKAFAEVLDEGLIEFDPKTRMWFIPNAIKHNMPANPNVVLSWRGPWSLLPECAAREGIAERLLSALSEVSDAFGKAFGEVSGKPLTMPSPKHPPKQEAVNSEQRTRVVLPEGAHAGKPAPTVPCPYDNIVGAYHKRLPSLPMAKLMPTARKRALQNMWGWVLRSKKPDGERRATSANEALAWFDDYFARASENDFLMGRTGRSAGHANWRCDLDFLLTDKGMKQVIEMTEAAT